MQQHIVYNEFLTIVLGPKVMHQYGLTLLKKGYYHGKLYTVGKCIWRCERMEDVTSLYH